MALKTLGILFLRFFLGGELYLYSVSKILTLNIFVSQDSISELYYKAFGQRNLIILEMQVIYSLMIVKVMNHERQ